VNSRYLHVLRTGFLICDVSPYRRFGNGADTAQVVATTPESGHSRFEPRKFFSPFVGCESLELSGQVCGSQSRIGLHKHVHVIGPDFESVNLRVQFLGLLVQQLPKPFFHRPPPAPSIGIGGTRANDIGASKRTRHRRGIWYPSPKQGSPEVIHTQDNQQEGRIPLPATASSSLRRHLWTT
jgi:hypothetical protein